MDRFTQFTSQLIKNEGFYANHLADKGGETIWGIASKLHPDVFNKIKELLAIDKSQALNFATQWYWKTFYNPLYDKLSTPLAYKLFDFSVNAGKLRAVLILQDSVRTLQIATHQQPITKDGIFGKQTLNAILQLDSEAVLRQYIKQIVNFYKSIVKRKPTQRVFIKGWINRAVKTLNEQGQEYQVVPPSLY